MLVIMKDGILLFCMARMGVRGGARVKELGNLFLEISGPQLWRATVDCSPGYVCLVVPRDELMEVKC